LTKNQNEEKGPECGFVVEHLPRVCEALGSISSTTKEKKCVKMKNTAQEDNTL
jgi:hypothetical protein